MNALTAWLSAYGLLATIGIAVVIFDPRRKTMESIAYLAMFCAALLLAASLWEITRR